MKRVLLVSATTGYQIRSFAEAATAAGATLLFASDRCDRLDDPWFDAAIPVRFHDVDGGVDAVRARCADAPPDAVLVVGDRPVVLAAHLNQAFGLPGHPPAAAEASRNKLSAKRAFRAAGLPTADFRCARVTDDAGQLAAAVTYPAVIKPLALSGSRGVMRVNSGDELRAAFVRLRALLQASDIRLERDSAHDAILVETFIPGDEYAIEGVMTRGVFQPFAIFDKPDPLDGPYFEETIYVTPSRRPRQVQEQILTAVSAAARALGLWHGPVHAECRVNPGGAYVLEVAARPIGGLCSRALRFVRRGTTEPSITLEEILVRHALGEDVSAFVREPSASAALMIPIPRRGVLRRVTGVDEARAVPGVEDVRITAKTDALLVPLPEGRTYLGFVFARADTADAAERAIRAAHARLHCVIDREVALAE